MNILESSISKTGSIANLARELGVKPNVVSNWRSRGAPYSWQQVMSLKYTAPAEPSGASQANCNSATQQAAASV